MSAIAHLAWMRWGILPSEWKEKTREEIAFVAASFEIEAENVRWYEK